MRRRLLLLPLILLLCCLPLSACGYFDVLSVLPSPIPSSSVSGGDGIADADNDVDWLNIYVIDCGQGDAIFVSMPNGKTMLIDAGTQANVGAVLDFLDALNVRHLDFVVATHPHEDHIGGLDDCIEEYEIGTVYMPDVVATTRAFENLLYAIEEKNLSVTLPEAGEYLIGDAAAEFSIQCLAPNRAAYDGMNDCSIVLRVAYGKRSVLLTGDAETLSENEMLMNGFDLSADVIKLGHHGSSTSSSEPFLSAVSPAYAVASCGVDNSYGHPHRKTLKLLKRFGVVVLRTDTDGTVQILTDGNVLTVQALGKV